MPAVLVDTVDLQALTEEVRALRAAVASLSVVPQKEWLTVKEYADYIGRSERTVLRRLRTLDTREIGGERMIRL